jgi:hypothetical protein
VERAVYPGVMVRYVIDGPHGAAIVPARVSAVLREGVVLEVYNSDMVHSDWMQDAEHDAGHRPRTWHWPDE